MDPVKPIVRETGVSRSGLTRDLDQNAQKTKGDQVTLIAFAKSLVPWWAQRFMRRLHPSSSFRSGPAGDRQVRQHSTTTDRAGSSFGLPPSSSGVGACSVQVRSRGLEFARGGRWCSRRPLRSTSLLAHRLFGFERQGPRRASCTPRSFHHGQRRCSPPARSVAHCAGGALVQEGPTSDVLCRFTGTDHRLQPTHRCLPTRLTSRCFTPGDLPARPDSLTSRPVKDDLSSSQDA
jgi:hypothetical protein